jgi:hypothetical protein
LNCHGFIVWGSRVPIRRKALTNEVETLNRNCSGPWLQRQLGLANEVT